MLGVYMLSFPFLVETRHTVLLFTREWILTEVHEVDPFILFKNIRNVEMQLGLDLIYNIFCTNEHWELRLFMRLSKNISKWQTFTFTQCREFLKKNSTTTLYIIFTMSLEKRLFSQYKNHVKPSGITKNALKMLSDVFQNENKGFKYCFLNHYAAKVVRWVVNVWLLLGLWGQLSPCSNSSRSMALDSLLPTQISVQQKIK